MKKIFTTLILLFIVLLLIPAEVKAELCVDSEATGLVPCGVARDGNNKIACPCEIGHFFKMIESIYSFIVWYIATPLAVLMLTIGGVLILISAGNPNLAGLGKKIIWVSVIGLALVFCAWVIVNFILTAMGYIDIGGWFNF